MEVELFQEVIVELECVRDDLTRDGRADVAARVDSIVQKLRDSIITSGHLSDLEVLEAIGAIAQLLRLLVLVLG